MEHELVGGFFGDGRGIRIKAQELAALGQKLFRVVGKKAETANTHETLG